MAKMMMGQIDHARARVREIKAKLLGEQPEPVKSYNTSALSAAIRSGEQTFTGAQLQKLAQEWASHTRKASYYNRPSFESIVLEHAFAKERAADKKRYDAERKVYDEKAAVVNAEATKVEDAIVLGDQHAALAALTDFAAFTV